ncbi:MAG: serine hydrolase [Chitinophagaceae bacterium]|nr:serine hydrolase [Chitinophagaceae bacterium]MCB9055783.1 serine hydrolase [Chitinophagales bacterium]
MSISKQIIKLLIVLQPILCLGQTPSFITDSLDSYIEQGLKDWDLPGLSIVIVKDGKPVVLKGYGVTNISTKEKVNENTLFMIASNTKLFTGLSLAQLEYHKKLSLNDKITSYFPDYKLYDPTTTELVTIKDLLCHRIGTKTFQGDFTFWNSKYSRKEIMQKMRLLKPVGLFRQDYGYCNSCFMTAGEVIPKVMNTSWEQYVQDSILTPLQMNRSTSISHGMADKNNVATPYTTSFTGELRQVPYDEWDNLGPAASIISSVNDLSHWLMFQLDSGQYNGKQIMPFSVLQKTRDVNIIITSRKSSVLPMHFRGYGLGLSSADYNGRQIYWHTGGAAGMVSNVCFVPEENLGIAILTNNDNQGFFEALRYQLLDAYLGVSYVNRSKQFLPNSVADMKQQLEEIAAWKARIKEKTPALPIKAYTGTYNNELYGSINISQKGKSLVIKFNGHDDLTARLDYMDNDQWLLQYDNIEYGVYAISFKINGKEKKVSSVTIKANDFVEYDPYVFTKE